jgi:hypothetical protein
LPTWAKLGGTGFSNLLTSLEIGAGSWEYEFGIEFQIEFDQAARSWELQIQNEYESENEFDMGAGSWEQQIQIEIEIESEFELAPGGIRENWTLDFSENGGTTGLCHLVQ